MRNRLKLSRLRKKRKKYCKTYGQKILGWLSGLLIKESIIDLIEDCRELIKDWFGDYPPE